MKTSFEFKASGLETDPDPNPLPVRKRKRIRTLNGLVNSILRRKDIDTPRALDFTSLISDCPVTRITIYTD